jgi:hypothetical protein
LFNYQRHGERHAETRRRLSAIGPVLLAAALMSAAVIVTQRPRPSYLLGAGVLYVWVLLAYAAALVPPLEKLDTPWVFLACAAILVLLAPSYRSLPLRSKGGALGLTYNELRPHGGRLCQRSMRLAIGEYATDIANYLCTPHSPDAKGPRVEVVTIASLPADAFSGPRSLVAGLETRGVGAAVIDRFIFQRYPGLQGCAALRDAFLENAWEQLAYAIADDGRCIAAYGRRAR